MTRAEKRKTFWERNRKSGGYLLKKKIGSALYSLGRGILLFGLCFLILQPLIQKIFMSFMAEIDLYDTTIITIPRNFSTQSYTSAWNELGKFAAFRTSFLLAIGVAFFQTLSCTLVGYGFARFRFPGKKILFVCVIITLIVPPTTLITPLYLYFQNFDIFGIIGLFNKGKGLNLLGKATPYLMMCATCTGYKAGLYIYMMRQHFRNEPKELEEAAYVDGCGKLGTFFKILLPGAWPMMVSCFLFAFVWQWSDQQYSRVFFPTSSGWKLVSTRLLNIVNSFNATKMVEYGNGYKMPAAYSNQITATGVLLALAPLLIIYVLAQKSFVESISQSGIKG